MTIKTQYTIYSEHLLPRQSIKLITDDDGTQSIILADSIYGKLRKIEIVDNTAVKVYPITKVGDIPELKSELVNVDNVTHFLTFFLHRWWIESTFSQQENYKYDKQNPDWIAEKIFP